MDAAIQIRGLRKSYGEHQVLKGVDLDIFKGEIFSLQLSFNLLDSL